MPLLSSRRAATFAALAIWAVSSANAVNPLLIGTYRGEDDRRLATSKFGEIRERDLLLYLVMRDDTMPDVVERYMTEPDHARRLALRERLHRGLEDFLIMMGAPKIELAGKYPRGIDPKAREVFLYPVYDLVWADHVARNELKLTSGDLRKFYDDQPELFVRPEQVIVRVIFARLRDNIDPNELEQAETAMEEAKRQADGGADFADLARRLSQAPSAENGGLLPPVAQGDMFLEFDDVVEELEPGQVSEPFRGPEGLYLVKLEKRVAGNLPEFRDIEEEVRKRVLPTALRYRQVYTLDKVAYTRHTAWRPRAWNSEWEGDWLVKAWDFRLTVGDFQRMFPEVVGPDCVTDDDVLREETGRVFIGEVMRRLCQDRDILGDERIGRARELSGSLLRARRLLAERAAAYESPTDETLRRFYRDRPELFQPMTRCSLAKIAVSLREPTKHSAVERVELIAQARKTVRPLVSEQVIVLKEIDKQHPTEPGDEPSSEAIRSMLAAYVQTLERIDQNLYEVRLERMTDFYDRNTLPEDLTAKEFDSLSPHTFIEPTGFDDRAVYWICEAREDPAKPGFDEIADVVRREYERVHADAARQSLLDEAMPMADPTWLYEQLPYKPAPRPAQRAVPHRVQVKPEEWTGLLK